MYKYLVAKSLNACDVYVNLITSQAGAHISKQPHLLNLIKEVLKDKKLTGSEVTIEHDMGRLIGNTNIVSTDDNDTIFYAQPAHKTVYSRYVKNRSLKPSPWLTLLLKQLPDDGGYEVTDIWVGPCCPPFPGDEKESAKSRAYWESHALVMDTQSIQLKSVTKACPY